jgi:predicted dehydrogenase
MDRIKLGYVGCGFMAQKVHIPNFVSIPGCELVALAEVRAELGRKVQDRYKVPRLYPHHLSLATAPDIDAVAVSADFSVQGDIARDLLAGGKHVFMEKPMAVSLSQADAILDAARATGARLMVGYMKRYDAGNELARQAVDRFRASGELGGFTYARNHGFCGDWICGLDTPMETTQEAKPQSPPMLPGWLPPQCAQQYLGYLQQYTHNLNLLRWFLDAGDDVAVRHVDLDEDGYTGLVILEVAGVRALLESGSVSHYRWDEHTQIYFRDGWVKAWAPPLLLKNTPAEVEIYRAGEAQVIERPIPQPAWSWSYKREAEHFIACLRSGEPFRSSGQDTRTDVRVMEEIFRTHLDQRGVV